MDIPDEVIKLVEQLSDATDMCLGDCLGDLAHDMRSRDPRERAVRAARAPRAAAVIEGHARSAQVAILRELAVELGVARNGKFVSSAEAPGLALAEFMARTLARTLEADAGQTGADDA